MQKDFYRRKDCRLCGNAHPQVVFSLKSTPPANDYVGRDQLAEVQEVYPLEVALCSQCGNVFILDIIEPEVLYKNFKYTSSSSPDLAKHFREYAQYVLKNFAVSGNAFIVDVGSNDGLFLKEFQESGLKVLGVDPARDIAQKATESGIETLGRYYDMDLAGELKEERGSAGIITSNNTMANVDDMKSFIESIRALLSPDGLFIFETGYLRDLVRNMVFDNIYHEHLSYFAVKPLDLFFRGNGMELIDIQRVATKGGSLRGVVQLQGGPCPRRSSVGEMIRSEEAMGLDAPEIYGKLQKRIDGEKDKLLHLVAQLKKANKKIAGYGASHSVTTFLYYFGLGDQLDFLLDDNASKQNKFSVGHHIPIFPSDEIYTQKPDAIIILAWRFYDMIVKKHQAYVDKGGAFIVPLPTMEVIQAVRTAAEER